MSRIDAKKTEIKKYLRKVVDPIKLPDCKVNFDGYPFVTLDGASGTGKTQQAFALLKAGNDLIYYVPETSIFSQRIYREMGSYLPNEAIESVERLQNRLKEKKKDSEKDVFSLQYLGAEKWSGFLAEVQAEFKNAVLTFDDNDVQYKSVDDLKHVVFFIDEANSAKNGSSENLRFLLNLGEYWVCES